MGTSTLMKQLLMSATGAVCIALGTVGTVQASTTIFNGGEPNLSDGREMTSWVEAEDFVLDADKILTGVNFWTLEDPNSSGDGTLSYFLFKDDNGKPDANPLFAGGGINRVKQATGRSLYGYYIEYQYSFDLENPLSLSANTKYWLGLKANSSFDYQGRFWETTSNGFGSSSQLSYYGDFNNWQPNNVQLAFTLTGKTKTPEPVATLGLAVFGAIGAASMLKRKQQPQ